MFTGIVEEAGTVEKILTGKRSTELTVRPRKVGRSLKVGSSLAVNGTCLTVVRKRGGCVQFDVLNETLARTNLGELKPGSLVNLERPMGVNSRLDGHFVLGHVDGTGTVRKFEKSGKDFVLEIKVPAGLMRYVVEKGSIAVDGMSLTVAGLGRDWIRIWIVPHTRDITNLRTRRAGELVNLEADILAKHIEKLMAGRRN